MLLLEPGRTPYDLNWRMFGTSVRIHPMFWLVGAMMGFGHALFEETIYQEGQLQNGDAFQYRLPVMKDIPEVFYSSMLEKEDGPGPFGSKGMSQTSIVTVAPAIGNAVYDALGVRVRSLPITPEKILRALGKI